MPYAFPQPAHNDADNLPGQSFTWSQVFVGFDLTGYTATMTIDGIATNLPCTVALVQIGANISSTVTLNTVLSAVTNTWLPGVYAYRVTLTAPDATTAIIAYGNLLELTPRQGSTYGTVGPQGPQGIPGPSTGVSPSTTTTAPFTQPAPGATVTVPVVSSAFWTPDQALFVGGGGDYIVSAIPDATHITLLNLDTPGSTAPGLTISSGARVTCNGYPGAGTEVLLTTANATPTALEFDLSWVAPLTSFRLDVVIVARDQFDESTFVLTGLFRKSSGGIITQTGTAQVPVAQINTAGANTWTGSLAVTSSGTAVSAMVVGQAGKTISWGGLAQILRVTGLV